MTGGESNGAGPDLNPALLADTATWIARLELVSHGTTSNTDSDGRNHGSDSKPPVTGHTRAPRDTLRELGDNEPEFLTLCRRLQRATSDVQLGRIRDDAKREHALAVRQPVSKGKDPEPGTLAWKRLIARKAQTGNISEIARLHGISRPTIYRIRDGYGEAA